MEIITITVCVKYSDILENIIYQNSKFFKKWYIITSPEDKNTQLLIENSKLSNIQILLYNDFYKDCEFNKGGAVRFGQNYLDINHPLSNILILDADIYLPDNFFSVLPKELKKDTLYGSKSRSDYWTLYDFINDKDPHRYKHGGNYAGFFQLYTQSIYKYSNSFNCGKCDIDFRNSFNGKVIKLELNVKHLGKERENWSGRKNDKKFTNDKINKRFINTEIDSNNIINNTQINNIEVNNTEINNTKITEVNNEININKKLYQIRR